MFLGSQVHPIPSALPQDSEAGGLGIGELERPGTQAEASPPAKQQVAGSMISSSFYSTFW